MTQQTDTAMLMAHEDGYGLGYSQGKEKAYAEVMDRVNDLAAHDSGCGCQPCIVVKAVFARLADIQRAAIKGRRCRPWWTGAPWGTHSKEYQPDLRYISDQ